MVRRPRSLRPDEVDLWQDVARTARPLVTRQPLVIKPKPKDDPSGTEAPPAMNRPVFTPKTRPTATAPITVTLAPDPLTDHPVQMDRRAYTRLIRGKLKPEARIDLHGMTLDQAHPALVGFVISAAAKGLRLVLVITGKGRGGEGSHAMGVLRRQVPMWLRGAPLAPLVLELREAHQRHGGGGAFYVYLRRGRG